MQKNQILLSRFESLAGGVLPVLNHLLQFIWSLWDDLNSNEAFGIEILSSGSNRVICLVIIQLIYLRPVRRRRSCFIPENSFLHLIHQFPFFSELKGTPEKMMQLTGTLRGRTDHFFQIFSEIWFLIKNLGLCLVSWQKSTSAFYPQKTFLQTRDN